MNEDYVTNKDGSKVLLTMKGLEGSYPLYVNLVYDKGCGMVSITIKDDKFEVDLGVDADIAGMGQLLINMYATYRTDFKNVKNIIRRVLDKLVEGITYKGNGIGYSVVSNVKGYD